MGKTLKRHPFSGSVRWAGQLLYIPSAIPFSMATVKIHQHFPGVTNEVLQSDISSAEGHSNESSWGVRGASHAGWSSFSNSFCSGLCQCDCWSLVMSFLKSNDPIPVTSAAVVGLACAICLGSSFTLSGFLVTTVLKFCTRSSLDNMVPTLQSSDLGFLASSLVLCADVVERD